MTAPQLALPPAGRSRPRHLLNVTTLVVVSGGTALFGALIAAYVTLADRAATWPPKGLQLDNYIGTMLAATAVMSAITVEWASWSLKHEDQAQAVWGLSLTLGFGLSFLNLLWYLGRKVGFGPGSAKTGPYAVIFFALIVAAGFVALLGVVALVMALLRTLARHTRGPRRELVRAVAWYWDFVVVAWLAVWATMWLLT
jgi:heme/copper-type cytochrome/quinol oxidase subunit 3